MQLLDDLGYDSKSGCSFGVYLCPKCNIGFKTRKGDVTQGKVKQCRTCSEKPRCEQADFSMPLVGVFSKPSKDGSRRYTFVDLECPICNTTTSYQAAGAKKNQYTECPGCRITKAFTGLKCCTKCKKDKPIQEFTSTKRTSTGKYSKCKKCRAEDAKLARSRLTKEEKYSMHAAATYGISKKEALFIRKEGTSCGICAKQLEWGNRHLDHCHTSGKVRGILCGVCNRGLGSFFDNITFLENAIGWLKKHND